MLGYQSSLVVIKKKQLLLSKSHSDWGRTYFLLLKFFGSCLNNPTLVVLDQIRLHYFVDLSSHLVLNTAQSDSYCRDM